MITKNKLFQLAVLFACISITTLNLSCSSTTHKNESKSMIENSMCPKCNGATDGWICSICGSVADRHYKDHIHAGSDRYCTMKCKACGLADVHCTCPKKVQ